MTSAAEMKVTTREPRVDQLVAETDKGQVHQDQPLFSARIAIIAFIAIPTVFFVGAYLIGGHLLLYTDNLLQSYPLRVLVGNDLRHGVFPAWDPYIWSGTPLMGGLNAGAFYPTTLLFAIFPAHAAWIFGEIFVYSATGIGTFLLFRAGGTSDTASFISSFSFVFAGAIATQGSVHLDMAEGLVSLPWALLAIRRIAEDGKWRWAGLFAIALAAAVLAGSPEALLTIAITSATYAVARWTIDRRCWRRFVTRLVPAAAFAFGSTSFLSIPALKFIATSNRGHVSQVNAAANALNPGSLLLGVVPYLEGGYRLFPQLAYFGPSNPTELGFYVGIIPLIAAFALLTPSWGRVLPRGERRTWYAVIVVGLVTAIAAGTALENILYHVPFYGSQHDSGRFVVEVDLGACALFAWWIDGGIRQRRADRPAKDSWYSYASAAIPLVIVLVLATWFAVDPVGFWSTLRTSVTPPPRPEGTVLAIVMAAVLALGGGALALARSRLERKHWLGALSAFVLVDVALFAGGNLYIGGQNPPAASQPNSVLGLIKANLTPGGRYAIFDPDSFDSAHLPAAGEANTGLLASIPSVSGYESIGDATYSTVTGTKVRADMHSSFLYPNQYMPLGLQVLVTVPEAFLVPVWPGSNPPVPLVEQPGTDPLLPAGNVIGPGLPMHPLAAARSPMTAGTTDTWWFGEAAAVSGVTLLLHAPSAGQLVQLGTVDRSGAVAWQKATRLPPDSFTVTVKMTGKAGVGLALRLLSGNDLGPFQTEIATGSSVHLLAGPFSLQVTARNWRMIGQVGNFTLFRALYTPRQAWLATPLGQPGIAGSVRVTSTSQNGATLSVHASSPSLILWSTAYDAGWRATIVPAGGAASTSVDVQRVGLIMGVEAPAGRYRVVFTYRPPGFTIGVAISLATVLAFAVGAGVLSAVYRRRARESDLRDEPVQL